MIWSKKNLWISCHFFKDKTFESMFSEWVKGERMLLEKWFFIWKDKLKMCERTVEYWDNVNQWNKSSIRVHVLQSFRNTSLNIMTEIN